MNTVNLHIIKPYGTAHWIKSGALRKKKRAASFEAALSVYKLLTVFSFKK
jgi:hypothetical protein